MQVRGRRGRKGDREWDLRNRLTRSAPGCAPSTSTSSAPNSPSYPPRIGVPILAAWNAKEDLLDLLALARTHPDREHVARLLHRFYHRCADS